MIGRNAIVSAALLSALLFSALAVASASAAQRAYTCTKAAPVKEYTDAHCTDKAGTAFGYVLINPGANTTVLATNERTAVGTLASTVWKLKGEIGGIATEVQCAAVHAHGGLTNAAESVSGTGTISFTKCTVTAPFAKGCLVSGGEFISNKVAFTTIGQSAGKLLFEPAAGEPQLATIGIKGCEKNMPPANNYAITGKFKASVSGATINTTHEEITLQGELKWGGVKAGIESSMTLTMAEGTEPNFTAGEGIFLK